MFTYALLAACFVALLSLIGAAVFGKNFEQSRIHRFIIPVAVGVFLGVTFFELIPETILEAPTAGGVAILVGFFTFYLLSHVLRSFHHHHDVPHDTCAQGGARLLLVGDAVHNLADGVVVATAFMVNPIAGVVATIGIALHEIPQEIAEYGVLIRSGCTRKRAALYNLLSASSIIVGVIATFVIADLMTEYIFLLTGFAAGNLLYIAIADLLPELRESHRDHFFSTFMSTLGGALAIIVIIAVAHDIGGHDHSHDHGDHSDSTTTEVAPAESHSWWEELFAPHAH
jgi:zinc and cadmium transporter